ncbi:MAG: TusE/DsrC/DsvC family sulfur relay protein [Pseudomonadota bacterium]|nr:TusE/DsrC/DsvC family sulfur relay protein [Pseudomonadota bacterium]
MPEYRVEDRTYEVDDDGFLQEPELWTEDVARDFALTEGITELTDAHWQLINYIRNYFYSYGVAPMVRKVCRDNKIDLDQVYKLFRSGPGKGACKVAGLAKPTGCV